MTPFHPISSSEDIQRIADAVKATLGDEIKALVENEVTKAVQPLGAKINHLKEENRSLFFKLDDLEQYGRRPIVRVSGIPETPNENTTEKIVTTLAKTELIYHFRVKTSSSRIVWKNGAMHEINHDK